MSEQRDNFAVVWGFGSTGREVGLCSIHATREEAREEARRLSRLEDNPACGYWTVKRCEECGSFPGAGCNC
jgi:hypothetical protein